MTRLLVATSPEGIKWALPRTSPRIQKQGVASQLPRWTKSWSDREFVGANPFENAHSKQRSHRSSGNLDFRFVPFDNRVELDRLMCYPERNSRSGFRFSSAVS